MGKKYDAYEQAQQAEQDAKWEAITNPTPETLTNAKQNEVIANTTFDEFLEDPTG